MFVGGCVWVCLGARVCVREKEIEKKSISPCYPCECFNQTVITEDMAEEVMVERE